MHAHEMQKKPDEKIKSEDFQTVPHYDVTRNAAMVKSWRVTPSSNVEFVTKMGDPAHKCATKRASAHNGPKMRYDNRKNLSANDNNRYQPQTRNSVFKR